MLSSSVFIAFHLRPCDPRSTKSGSLPIASLSQFRSSFLPGEPFAFQPSNRTPLVSIVLLLCVLLPARSTARTLLPAQSSDQSEKLLADAKSFFQQAKFGEADRTVRQYLND